MTEQPAAIIYKTRDNAITRDPSAIARKPLPDARRRPLGLAPVIENDEPERDNRTDRRGREVNYRSGLWDDHTKEQLDGAPALSYLLSLHDLGMGVMLEMHNAAIDEVNACIDAENRLHKRIEALEDENKRLLGLQAKLTGLEVEIARLTAKLAESTAKVGELAFVSERLRVEKRGPAGQRGERGLDGKDAPPAKAAPVAVSWTVDESAFTATPIGADGKPAGAVLHLRGLFQAFNDAISADE